MRSTLLPSVWSFLCWQGHAALDMVSEESAQKLMLALIFSLHTSGYERLMLY